VAKIVCPTNLLELPNNDIGKKNEAFDTQKLFLGGDE